MSKFCMKCGFQLPDDAMFCQKCGAPQNVSQPADNPQPAQAVTPVQISKPAQPSGSYKINLERPAGYKQNRKVNSVPMNSGSVPSYGSSQQANTGSVPSYGSAPQQPYGSTPQQPYGSAPQQPYGSTPQQPYGSTPQQPYGSAPQQPYGSTPQQPYGSVPQQPYGSAPQQPYGSTPQQLSGSTSQQSYGTYTQPSRPVKKRRGKKGIAALFLLVIVGVGGFFLIKKQGGANEEYEQLCELTAHGTESYLYARMLTEQLLETDTVAADPNEVNALFDECLDAWKAVDEVSAEISERSEKLGKKADKINPDKKKARQVFAIPAFADAPSEAPSAIQSVSGSISSCAAWSSQISYDARAAYSEVTELRSVYSGRSTSSIRWHERTESVSHAFSTEVFISGEIQGTEFTSGSARSVHTLSRQVKTGSLTVTGATTLVNVGSRSSTIVTGSNDSGVVMEHSEIGSYIDGSGSTISISTETTGRTSRITFHEESLSGWFILNKVGGYSLTRHEKSSQITVEQDFTGIEGITTVDESRTRIRPPEQTRKRLTDYGGHVGNSRDIVNTAQQITNGNSNNTSGGDTGGNNTPTEEGLRNRTDVHPGSGNITVRMIWATHDDLDLHMSTPDGSHIYFGRKEAGGGILDVDMNASTVVDDPIENIYFPDPESGHYKVWIKDYRDRTPGKATRYIVSVTIDGEETIYEGTIGEQGAEKDITEFDYHSSGRRSGNEVNNENLERILSSLEAGQGDITVSMLWGTQDDLDLHIENPDGSHVYYSNKNAGGGVLDIDANSSGNMMDNPVENIYYAAPQSGHYKVYINDYNDRTPNNSTHYLVRVQIGTQVQEFEGDIDTTGTNITIIEFDYGGGSGNRIPNGSAKLGDHSYFYYENGMTWLQAKDFCESIGGHLVTVTSAEEQSFIENNFSGSGDIWLGGFESGGSWYWITGEEMSYTNWRSGEPNGSGWVMQFWTAMQWDDTSNDVTQGFICEWDGLPNIINVGELDERLNQAGASVGAITVSLGWSSEDDLDLHVFTPNENEIYFGERSADGGELDVDMIPSRGDTPPCAENVYFADPMNGEYFVYVYLYDDCTDGVPTNYIVKVQVGDDVKTFEGSIDGTDNYIEICGFRYNGAGTGGSSGGNGGSSSSGYGASGSTANGGFARLSGVSWDSSAENLNFVLEFSGLEDTAWIGIVPAGTAYDENSADNADVTYKWLSGVTSGQHDKLTYSLSNGNWEVRVYPSDHNDDTPPLCVVPFTVGAVADTPDIDPPDLWD